MPSELEAKFYFIFVLPEPLAAPAQAVGGCLGTRPCTAAREELPLGTRRRAWTTLYPLHNMHLGVYQPHTVHLGVHPVGSNP